jgi:anti-anti-sigma regulatory factor
MGLRQEILNVDSQGGCLADTATADSGRILKLSGELRINVAEELRAALLDYVCTASRPVVDLSEVTECDAAGWQLLISAGRTAEHSGQPFELVGLTDAIREAGESLGLSADMLGPAGRGCENAN